MISPKLLYDQITRAAPTVASAQKRRNVALDFLYGHVTRVIHAGRSRRLPATSRCAGSVVCCVAPTTTTSHPSMALGVGHARRVEPEPARASGGCGIMRG